MISQLISLYTFVIFVRIILSWFPSQPGGALGSVNRVLIQVTEPVLGPARRLIPSLGPIDISPIVVVIALGFVQRMLQNAGL
ncbi:MAG: YggT family protein [Actinomycetota bacterium]|jgi:YggT family protein|nr:YggT family protein [Actinomycetota bacterium]MBM3815926.1 YggT family protein [Actinomycetota bacterium]